MTAWRNGSASDSRSEGCVFESRRGHYLFDFFFPLLFNFLTLLLPLIHGKNLITFFALFPWLYCIVSILQ